MNRQLRRVQKKADQKQEKAKAKVKKARREKRKRIMNRGGSKKQDKPKTPAAGRTRVGRWSGPLSLVTGALLIGISFFPPGGESQALNFAVKLLYYALFAYFVCSWFLRKGIPRALYISVGIASVLAIALQFGPAMLGLETDVRNLLFALPAAIAGGLLSQLVFDRL